jgi:hypothetical protein
VIAIGLGNHIDQEAKSRLEWFTGDPNAIFTTRTDDERDSRTSTIGNIIFFILKFHFFSWRSAL